MFIHDRSWIILLCIFFTLFILSLLGFYYRRSRKIINGSTAEILFPLGCCSSYFGIASLIYIGVVLIKAGIDLPFMHTREQEMGELLFSIGVFIHSCHLYINLEKDNKIYQ